MQIWRAHVKITTTTKINIIVVQLKLIKFIVPRFCAGTKKTWSIFVHHSRWSWVVVEDIIYIYPSVRTRTSLRLLFIVHFPANDQQIRQKTSNQVVWLLFICCVFFCVCVSLPIEFRTKSQFVFLLLLLLSYPSTTYSFAPRDRLERQPYTHTHTTQRQCRPTAVF